MAQKQSANTLANNWRQIELASILANFPNNFFLAQPRSQDLYPGLGVKVLGTRLFVAVNSYLTNSTNKNTRYIHVICVTSQNVGRRSVQFDPCTI